MPEANLAPLQDVLAEYAPQGRAALLPALHAAQTFYGHLSEPVLSLIAQMLSTPLADVHGVVEFYALFYNHPVGQHILRVCTDPVCAMRGGEEILNAILHHLNLPEAGTTPDDQWTVERAPCLGLCARAPAANLGLPPASPPAVHLSPPAPQSRPVSLLTAHPSALLASLKENTASSSLDHVGGAPRLLTALCGYEKAASLAEYEAAGGMQALRRWIGTAEPPQKLIDEIKASGLVGMGGAAFPTGLKWQGAADAEGTPKYFIINADESEPGTFKDRILLEGDPCRILEGAVLGAYAVGANKAYAFVRGEYPLGIQRLQNAVSELVQAGYLGPNILGTTFSLDLEIRVGAGAYICGEETALFSAIQGERGFPRIKPPFPTTHGLFGKPTAVNNVETLSKVPYILAHGAAIYRRLGTERSPGTKLFCLSGDVAQPGVYEVPFGTTLRSLLLDMAGGVAGGSLQAVLFGGAAGVFAGPSCLDVRLSFEDLRTAGLPLGSGVIMVFNHHRDLRDAVLRLARFFAHESCGKCYPCQLGTQRQVEILERFTAGTSQAGDVSRLSDVGWTMADASLCGLGQTAASAVLSLLDLRPDLFPESATRALEPAQ